MFLNAAGDWVLALLLLLGLGLPVQVAVGGLLALGRPIVTGAALLVPLVLLILGYCGTIAGMDTAIAALRQASDPGWAPWFALDDRARAMLPAAIGGAGGALLALPVVLGAAWANLQAGAAETDMAGGTAWARLARRGLPGLGLAAVAVIAGGEAMAGVLGPSSGGQDASSLLLPALGGVPFALAATVAMLPSRNRGLEGAILGFGSLGIASLGLATAAAALPALTAAQALGDYAAPFAAVGDVAARTRNAWFVNRVAALSALGFVGSFLPALFGRDWRRAGARSGTDLLVCASLAALALLAGVWAGARERVLSHHAGAHGAAVLVASAGYEVPHKVPIPARVLIGPVDMPRWLVQREQGGVETHHFAGGLEAVGPSLLRDDGLMLPPSLPLEDFYLALFRSDAGRIAIVGCSRANRSLLADIRHDPLLATGRCAAFPLDLRVTSALDAPRVLIALADRFIDDGGDVLPVDELEDIAGRDVILRGQVDATMADLVAVLRVLAPAASVYLGWGVTLDGDNLPIGVDPGLRIRKSAFERLERGVMTPVEPP